jgi:hypothetical protein
VEGFETWRFPNSKAESKEWVSGEMPLERRIGLFSLFLGRFDVSLEGRRLLVPLVHVDSDSCQIMGSSTFVSICTSNCKRASVRRLHQPRPPYIDENKVQTNASPERHIGLISC